MRLKMENRSHRYDINRPRPRHEHKYAQYKMCHSTIMVICTKQHLSDSRSSIYEKVKQHWGWIEKMRFYKKASSVLKQLLINSPVRKLLSSLVSKTNNQISVLSLIISLSITDPSEVFA